MRKTYKQFLIAIYGLVLVLGGFVMGKYIGRKHAVLFWSTGQDYVTPPYWLPEAKTPALTDQRPWLTVFVHGSFGLMLGLLSIPNVLQDSVSGSTYRKVTRGMRNDDYYFKDQIMLERGLVAIQPSFDPAVTNYRPYAAYPVLKTYEQVAQAIDPQHEHLTYTFGWTGLMSQNSRRFEAIRLYNALCQELERLAALGIKPRIRLIAHSHGGNVCLNMAGLWTVLNHPLFARTGQQEAFSSDTYQNEALAHTYKLLLSLGSKEQALQNEAQKRWDYVPTNKDLRVDELVLFGTPIQPETELFCKSGFFGTVYNFYSGEDIVQILDVITSKKQAFSNQRLRVLGTPSIGKDRPATRVVQAKITFERMAEEEVEQDAALEAEEDTVRRKRAQEALRGTSIFAKRTKDPAHKELWFVQWREQETSSTPFLWPLPVVVLTPLLLESIRQMQDGSDLDINLQPDTQHIIASVRNHRKSHVLHSATLDRNLIEQAKRAIAAWRPQDVNDIRDFQNAYKYLRN